ncbi:MAG: lipid-A-disaccharide synthase [bacterium]
MSRRRILLTAAEVSGDVHAANLARAMKRIDANIEFVGIGGEKMRQAGVDVRATTVHMGTVGVWEGFKYYPSFLRIEKQIKRMLREEPPNLVLLIDSRDFNLRIARLAKKRGIPIIYYIAPPAWAWPDWATKRAVRDITKVIAIFPFEAELYRRVGADVTFVGHPLVGVARPILSKGEAYKKFSLTTSHPIIGLLPGSRAYEINGLLPIMLQAAAKIKKSLKNVQFLLPVATAAFEERITRLVRQSGIEVKIISDNIYDLISVSDLVITASGTATLEAACLATPMIVVYRTSLSTWILGHILIKFPYISLPNILASKRIVPELLQFRATPNRLANLTLNLWGDSQKLEQMKIELNKVTSKLGQPGAIERAARVVVESLS